MPIRSTAPRNRLIGIAVAIAWPLAVLPAGCAGAEGPRGAWDGEAALSDGSGEVWEHGIAASGRLVHMVWGSNPIRYRRSTDEGATWSESIVLNPSGETRLTDPLVAEGANVYVVYLQEIGSTRDWCCERPIGNIFFRRSRDGGTTWDPEVRLTSAGGAFRVSLAAAGPRLDLVWMDFRLGRRDVYYRRSLDGGGTWEPEVRLVAGDTEVGAGRPQVASLGRSVHVVWMDGRAGNPRCYSMPECSELYTKRSLDGGATWGEDVRLTFEPPFSGRPDVAVAAPGTVIVAYDEDRDDNQGHEEYVLRSEDDGATWGAPQRITDAPGFSTHPDLRAAGSSVHLAWRDDRPGEGAEIYYRHSPDGGATWDPEERVTSAFGVSTTPLMAVTPGYAHVIWLDDRTGVQQVWYRRRALAR